jgi:hypothetical protein
MNAPGSPARNEKLQEAVEHARTGDWERAHEIAQDHEGDAIANWIHAVCHRMEGDLANARYWYARCRRELRESVDPADELLEIRAALSASRSPRG